MIEILKKDYWSKSEAFLLPLTGLAKSQKYPVTSYLFWEQYTIEDYNLILKFTHDNPEEFAEYCRKVVFPVLDRNGCLVESHDMEDGSIIIVDISEWALDVEMFLRGRYSKLSKDAKDTIEEYHIFFDKGPKKPIHISMALDPHSKFPLLEGKTAMEYVSDNYGINMENLRKLGELGSIYDRDKETLPARVAEI